MPGLSGGIERVLLAGPPGIEADALLGLLRSAGMVVRWARVAQDALAIAQGFSPDLIFVDWQDLDVPGEKFIRMLRDEKLSQSPFIVAVTGDFATATARNDALHAGGDLVLGGRPTANDLAAALSLAGRQKARNRAQEDKLHRVMGRLSDVQARFDSLDNDLSEAKKLQQSLMRERHVALGPAEISLILRSSGHVGGDLVGHFPISDGVHGFFALDVSGHGVSSALMTARLAGYLSATNARQNIAIEMVDGEPLPRSPAAAVEDLNTLVMEDLETDHYFTMILGHIDGEAGKVTFAQAGHPHPVIQRAQCGTEFLAVGGLPVGLIPGADYKDTEVDLKAGERLLILSDGFTEASLPDGTFLGEDGLVRLLDASRDQRGPTLLETLVWDLGAAVGEDDFQDDLSGVLIEVLPNPNT
ncbi:MAG: fused response regulator/phosphatase [Pseudomonadota bacterium]